jgi:cell division septation protein DedD
VREEDDARRAWSQFQQKLGAAIAGLEPFIERAETKNGTFYRVQIGPFAEGGNAESLCVELKKQDASCFVVSR